MRVKMGMPEGLRRARRTAALARATLAGAGAVLIAVQLASGGSGGALPLWQLGGLGIIFVTAQIQLIIPSDAALRLEESLAPIAAVLIVGIGPERISVVWLLWLAAVACGVLARGGRQGSVGRAVLLLALALPIVRDAQLRLGYACACLTAVALLLVCGRVTRELRAMLDRARWDADHDSLTGVLSRAAFRERLDRVAGADGAGRALVLLDIDNFGAVNKTAGHAAGDALLRAVAEGIGGLLGEDALVGRLGGDEFAAVVEGGEVEAIGARLLDEVQRLAQRPAYAGVVLLDHDGQDAESLLRAADVALRVAKGGGTARVNLYTGAPIAASGGGGALAALERLIGGDGLEIVVQPIVGLSDGGAHAYEALARFRQGAISSPLHWFALADELGLRDELELACLQAGLRLLDSLPAGARLSVNLSGPLLLHPRATQLLTAVSQPARLILEMTENSLLQDSPEFARALARWRARGIAFAVDDVGAGYSGLRQIATLRPSYLKLDRSLVTGIDADPDRAALVSALLGYVRQVGAHLVAEGVETDAELATLRGLGAELIQGYRLGRPAAPWPAPASIPSAPAAAALSRT